jgi:hypothetical protein
VHKGRLTLFMRLAYYLSKKKKKNRIECTEYSSTTSVNCFWMV